MGTLVINGCRIRSGGGKQHALEMVNFILTEFYEKNLFSKIIFFSSTECLKVFKELGTLPKWFEIIPVPRFSSIVESIVIPFFVIRNKGVLINLDAGSLSFFLPRTVVIIQDLLFVEALTRTHVSIGLRLKIRQVVLRFIAMHNIQKADGVIFLTEYSRRLVLRRVGIIRGLTTVIGHGLSGPFQNLSVSPLFNLNTKKIKLIYVSPVAWYKNHSSVISELRDYGRVYNKKVELTLVGAVRNTELDNLLLRNCPHLTVTVVGPVKNTCLPELIKRHDFFLFASSCEAFGITLLEGMASGVPVICSNKSSLPEILRGCGYEFEPEVCGSLKRTLRLAVRSSANSESLARAARERALQFIWREKMSAVFDFLMKATSSKAAPDGHH